MSEQYIYNLAGSFPLLRRRLDLGRYFKKTQDGLLFDLDFFIKETRPLSTSERHLCNFVITIYSREYAAANNCLFDLVGAARCMGRDSQDMEIIAEWIVQPYSRRHGD